MKPAINTVIVAAQMYSLDIPSKDTWREWRTSIPIHGVFKNKKLEIWHSGLYPWKCGYSFHVPQMHHIKHAGAAHTCPPPPTPGPQLSKTPALKQQSFWISQEISFRQKRKGHRSEAIGQCSNKWLTLSLSDIVRFRSTKDIESTIMQVHRCMAGFRDY